MSCPEENAITREWQNQKHCPSIRRNMQALPPLEEWPCCNGATKTDWKKLAGTQAKVQGLQKGARQLKSRKPLRKTQGQASFLDRRVRNMENRRGPLNRRIRRYSILQQLNFGDTSHVLRLWTAISSGCQQKNMFFQQREDPSQKVGSSKQKMVSKHRFWNILKPWLWFCAKKEDHFPY